MSKAALLIDWDNICGALGEASLECHLRELPGLLMENARKWASDRDVELTRAFVLAPNENFDAELEDDLEKVGIEIEKTSSLKQAADVRMCLRALLLNIEKGIDHFILVSEDQGFLALAHELEASRSCTCSIWAFSKERASDRLQRYKHLEMLEPVLNLERCRGDGDASYQLLACLASLAQNKEHFLHFANARGRVAALGTFELATFSEISAAWFMAKRVGYFTSEPRPGGEATNWRDRRIDFAARDVRRLFMLYDELLMELDKQLRLPDNSIVNARGLLASFSHPLLGDWSRHVLLRQLIEARILTQGEEGKLGFRWRSTRLGLVGSLRRLAANAWTILERKQPLTLLSLPGAWPEHVMKTSGGNRTRFIPEGKHVVGVAKTHGLIHRPTKHSRVELNRKHPIAVEAKRGLEAVIREVLTRGGRTGYRALRDDLLQLPLAPSGIRPLGGTPNECKSWLELATATRHIRMKPGREWDFVELLDTPFVARVRAEVESGVEA